MDKLPGNAERLQLKKQKELNQCIIIFIVVTIICFVLWGLVVFFAVSGSDFSMVFIPATIAGLISMVWFYSVIMLIAACVASTPRKSYAPQTYFQPGYGQQTQTGYPQYGQQGMGGQQTQYGYQGQVSYAQQGGYQQGYTQSQNGQSVYQNPGY
eukprot:TRINITY_DN442_c0_g1_i1.p1 TRINITY_DN442_c0_g1~~TRINITY_DN442_c0_g1_i1.p1  ORF type:complete len:163 (-),score=14.09 TRINITY_DN442_c0_g1_i1:58-519(-)